MKPVDWRTSSKLILPSPSASNKNENIFDSISSVPLFSKKSPIGTDPSVILPSNWNIPFYACFSTFFEKNSCQIIDKKSERDELRDSQCCKISEILYWSTFSWNPFRYISSRALLVPVSPTFWCLYIFLKNQIQDISIFQFLTEMSSSRRVSLFKCCICVPIILQFPPGYLYRQPNKKELNAVYEPVYEVDTDESAFTRMT